MAVTIAAWLSIGGGAVIAALGLSLIGALFLGRGVPVGGAGAFVVLTVGVAPLVTACGVGIVIAGFALRAGREWAATGLEVGAWVVVAASIGCVIWSLARRRHIHTRHVLRGGLFLLVTGVPAAVMIGLLHSG